MNNINITDFTKNVNNIQNLSDRPNTADGLTPQELKVIFDKAGIDIKEYINGTQNPEIEAYLKQLNQNIKIVETTLTDNYVKIDDTRLNNSRKCNNEFDNALESRKNLKIEYGTSLPATADEGSIFFLY